MFLRCFNYCVERHCNPAARLEQADSSRGISLLSVLCFCQRRKSRLSQSRSLLRSPGGDHSDFHRVQTRGPRGSTESVGEYNDACAGPSEARGSVAIVPPHLPSIYRRSVFNELPASLYATRVSAASVPISPVTVPDNTLPWFIVLAVTLELTKSFNLR